MAHQENTRSMDLFENLEIYIPVEAEVKSILLWSLPNSVLRQMGLPQSNSGGSRKLAESPEGIWICPAVLQKKGQKVASQEGNSLAENVSSLMAKQAPVGPLRMSFVSSNHAAYKVLKDTMPGKKVSPHTPHTSLPSGKAPRSYQGTVIIYHGRIYLSIRKHSRSQGPQETPEPQPASQSFVPSTSDMSSKSLTKRQSPQAALQPADMALQRKRLRVTLPQISSKQLRDILTKTQSTKEQELRNDKNKTTTCKQNRKGAKHKGRDAAPSKTAHSVPQSTDGVHSSSHQDSRAGQAAEEAAGPGPAWFQSQGEQQEDMANNDSEIQDLGGEEAEHNTQNNDTDRSIKVNSGEPVEQSNTQSWTRRESPAASTSRQQEYDYKELAQEEMIAQKKAKLLQAINKLPSSK